MSDDTTHSEVIETNGAAEITPQPEQNGSVTTVNGNTDQPLTNGTVTRNKRICRRKAAYKEDYTTIKTANQIKSLRLKSTAAARATRIPKLPPQPCKAGTNVVVKAKVLQEVPDGLLIMSVQWRGKEYCGCFIDTNKQGWALPRFDDPKVSSIAFLTKKAQLLASDVEASTDDEYSPKTKRKKASKGKKNKKRKVKNGDTSNGKSVKTPTKPKAGRPSNAERNTRRQSVDNIVENKSDASSEKLPKSEKKSEKTEKKDRDRKSPSPEKEITKSETKVANNIVSEKPEEKLEKAVDKPAALGTSVIVKTESNSLLKCIGTVSNSSITATSSPVSQIPPPSSIITAPKQIRTEKTATIPVGTLSSSPFLKQTAVSSATKPLASPFSNLSSPSPSPQINGALVSPLHNHSFPVMIPPPFFIPNFLQSAKFLAEGVKRTQSSEVGPSQHPTALSGDFNSLFAKNSLATPSQGGSSSLMSDNPHLRNKMT